MTSKLSISVIRELCRKEAIPNDEAAGQAAVRQQILTKPLGSLGRLEDIAIHLARWQGRAVPRLDHVQVLVFAGSHGITAHGVSAFPPEVTAQMVANFQAGGAAINQLSKAVGATLDVIPLSNGQPTADFTRQPAMTEDEFIAAVETGYNAVASDADLICLGEMGIGNTTTAATLCAALFGGKGADWVGRGTGVDDEGLKRKANVVDAALVTHAEALSDPLQVMRRMGGRELAAIFGAALAARERAFPILLDGFVTTASVAALAKLSDSGLDHALAGHVSAEAQHGRLLRHLRMTPLLDLGMRLGEASGACVAVGLLRAAVACHTGMATFAEAGVSEG